MLSTGPSDIAWVPAMQELLREYLQVMSRKVIKLVYNQQLVMLHLLLAFN